MLVAKNPTVLPVENPVFGRCPIYTDEDTITESNLLDVLSNASVIHMMNQARITYLWGYYKGEQDILGKTKEIRPEINNKIVENRANEIVSFKTGYFVGEPMQYVSHDSRKENMTDEILQLNDYMDAECKSTKDKELVDWMHICGTGYRMVLPNPEADEDNPFNIHVPDPRFTFVVYSRRVGHRPMLGVQYIIMSDGTEVYSCYTETEYYEVRDGRIVSKEYHPMGGVPIIEYPLTKSRQGAFEIVLPLLDAINACDSDRLDGVDQFIQSFIKFVNCDIDQEEFVAMKQLGAIKVSTMVQGCPADVSIVSQELNQQQTQVLKDDLHQAILDICGMPNRNGGSSTSDTGSAVIMRDGWSNAEARAKDTELMFKASERRFLKIALNICRATTGLNLKVKDIEMAFTRRNYSDLLTKSQVLTTMLSSNKIHPELAFTHCGLFIDPEAAYSKSAEYAEEMERKEQEQLAQQAQMANANSQGSESKSNATNTGSDRNTKD